MDPKAHETPRGDCDIKSSANYSIRAVDAITVLEAAIQRYGPPQYIRSDNGPEFIAQAIQAWLKNQRIRSAYIQP